MIVWSKALLEKASEATSKNTGNGGKKLAVVCAVAVFCGIGVAVYKFTRPICCKRGKKKADTDDLFDFEDDEYEDDID